jgi:hypothetical protein
VFSDATKYAMGALKLSLHSCYFCYRTKTASLDDEVAFFKFRLGRERTSQDLLNLRKEHQRSFAFVLICVPILIRLHLRKVCDSQLPRAVARA